MYKLFSPNIPKRLFIKGILLSGYERIANMKKPSMASTYMRNAFL